MKKSISTTLVILGLIHSSSFAASLTATPANAVVNQPSNLGAQPVRTVELLFNKLLPSRGSITLKGFAEENTQVEFGVRSDELVSQAILNLEFTPSPSLVP